MQILFVNLDDENFESFENYFKKWIFSIEFRCMSLLNNCEFLTFENNAYDKQFTNYVKTSFVIEELYQTKADYKVRVYYKFLSSAIKISKYTSKHFERLRIRV